MEILESIVKKKMPSSNHNGCTNAVKRKAVEALVIDGPEKKKVKQPRCKLLQDRWKRHSKKQQGIMVFSVSCGISNKKNADHHHQGTFKTNHQEITFRNSNSSGGLSADHGCCSSNPTPAPLTDNEEVVKKALRAARLTTRFAEIISKANSDKAHVQQEIEKIHVQQETEKLQLKKEEAAELREQQRETARVALQMMEKTADFEDNLMILKELEMLSQCCVTYIPQGYNGSAMMVLRGLQTGKVLKPLEQLGLRMKEEFTWDYDDDDEDDEALLRWEIEEGEIIEY